MSDKQPLVSVIMPTYNYGQFIADAIQSILFQTYKNLELIIIDNHSSDNTEELDRSFSDERINYFKFENKGVIAASRNFGIKKASGRYIAFIDSDDIWLEKKIEIQVSIFENDPTVALVFCPLKIKSCDENLNNRIVGSCKRHMQGYIYQKLILYNFIPASSVMIRSSIQHDVGYFDESPQMRCVEDFDLWLRIAKKYKIVNASKIMGIYRVHKNNLLWEGSRLERTLRVINREYAASHISRRLFRKARAQTYFREGWNFAGKMGLSARLFFYKALHENYSNIKMIFIIIVSVILSYFPPFCRFFKKKLFDKKIANLILN